MPEAARVTDAHVCVKYPTHVGGPVLPPCCPTVLIGGLPAARAGDTAQCNGPPDRIKKGSPTVIIGNEMAARKDDPTDGGSIKSGCPTVLIGDEGKGDGQCLQQAATAGVPFLKTSSKLA